MVSFPFKLYWSNETSRGAVKWACYQKNMKATLLNDLDVVIPGVKTAKSTNEHNHYQTEYCALWNESMGHKNTVNMFDYCS